jgi:hypothetical protein
MTHTLREHVTVAVPYGQDGEVRQFTGFIEAKVHDDERDALLFRIRFDDPLIYGGTGVAWVTEDMIR